MTWVLVMMNYRIRGMCREDYGISGGDDMAFLEDVHEYVTD